MSDVGDVLTFKNVHLLCLVTHEALDEARHQLNLMVIYYSDTLTSDLVKG